MGPLPVLFREDDIVPIDRTKVGVIIHCKRPRRCVATLQRIRDLQAALKAKDENWQRAAEEYTRQVDKHLVEHGLPARTQEAHVQLAAMPQLGIGPGLGEMLRARGIDPEILVDQKPRGRR